MGCASSSPVKEEEKRGAAGASEEKVQDDHKEQNARKLGNPAGAVSTTRARRLSNIVVQNTSDAQAPNVIAPITANSKDTRARRLSYVTNDPNAMKVHDVQGGHDDAPAAMAPIQPGGGGLPPLKLQVACMSRAGKEPGFKKTNQDNCFAFEKYITEDQSLFGAMDGHGPHGHLVSGYVKQHLPIILVNHLTSEGKTVENALTSGFLEVDKGLSSSRIDCEFSGSTCVVGYIHGRSLTTAWVGDSRGVIGYDAGNGTGIQALDLTNDHKPTLPEEKERILKSNGRVEKLVDEVGQPMGPHRVWLQYAWIPGLAMSRALGDVLAHQVGVSSEPEHTVIDLDPTHKFMILASDGVWEFITSKEAVDIVAQYETVEEACRQLVDEAYQRWLTEEEGVVDDITAVIVFFGYN